MLTFLAHIGRPLQPHDLWSAWSVDPLVVTGLLVAVWCYRRGPTARLEGRRSRWRARAFYAGLVAVAVALVSPLDALSSALASAHMVQHVLLILVAAPLLTLSAPGSALLQGAPVGVRRMVTRSRAAARLACVPTRLPSHPALVWLLHVGALWLWHAAALYDAALTSALLHAVEHAAFLLTGVLFWRMAIGVRVRVNAGLAMLLVFAMALQSTFLAFLLTFARSPWYAGYADTTQAWGLTPLADQQLAGVIMWVPAGFVYLGAALALLAAWFASTQSDEVTGPLSEPLPVE